jgi:hypothetical protein
MFTPKTGRMPIPTTLLTALPFERCPACEAEVSEVTRLRTVFACGMTQMLTDGDEYAISASCPYAMCAVHDLRMRRVSREKPGQPGTLVMFAPGGFSIGDKVRWLSQSAGKETVKKGVIVAEVPPDARPEDYIPDGMRKNSTNGYGRSRPHTTYLVKVSGKGSMVYWPRVHCLEKI